MPSDKLSPHSHPQEGHLRDKCINISVFSSSCRLTEVFFCVFFLSVNANPLFLVVISWVSFFVL
jgi:hypothetical protein